MTKLYDLETPIRIDAIRCRLRQDIDRLGIQHSIPSEELRLMLDIIDAARHCVKEWVPTPWEKDNGHGTGVGMRVAEDRLIREVRKELA